MRLLGSLVVAGALVAAVSASAGTVSGQYDGYCDGFTITTAANGAAYGQETGCVSGPIAGGWAKKFNNRDGGRGFIVNEDQLPDSVYEINTTLHTWQIYLSDGSILNSGTWTPVNGNAVPNLSLPKSSAPQR
jgi:hypothetical protein